MDHVLEIFSVAFLAIILLLIFYIRKDRGSFTLCLEQYQSILEDIKVFQIKFKEIEAQQVSYKLIHKAMQEQIDLCKKNYENVCFMMDEKTSLLDTKIGGRLDILDKKTQDSISSCSANAGVYNSKLAMTVDTYTRLVKEYNSQFSKDFIEVNKTCEKLEDRITKVDRNQAYLKGRHDQKLTDISIIERLGRQVQDFEKIQPTVPEEAK